MNFIIISLLMTIGSFATNIYASFWPVFVSGLSGSSMTAVGIGNAISGVIMLILIMPIGKLADIIGKRIFLLIGGLGGAYIMYQYTFITTIQQYYSLQYMVGVFAACSSVQMAFISEKIGQMKGIKNATMGLFRNIAFAASAWVGSSLIVQYGFRALFLPIAVVQVVMLILTLLYSYSR